MGVAGSGKTTVAKLLSLKTGLPFYDGDDFHSAGNKEKMKAGLPLNDKDREQWLHHLNILAIEQSKLNGAVIACSALKEKYRIVLANNIPHTQWIFLRGTYELINYRMKQRDHFMPTQLLQSQFDDLEIPEFVFTIDIKNTPEKIVEIIVQYLNRSSNNH